MQVFAAEALQGGSDTAERCPNWPVMTVRIPIVGLPLRCSTAPTTSQQFGTDVITSLTFRGSFAYAQIARAG